MLNIKTVKNPLVTDESKDSFCFRSTCSQSLSQRQLAGEMRDWNTSFTEADYLGMLSVMESVVVKYLAKGYSVELPFGTVRPNVTGTCANIQDGFALGTGNHSLGFLFNASESGDLSVASGRTLRLHGRNLSFDIADTAQGVFLENEGGVSRVEIYGRRGTNIVDAAIPAGLEAGIYTLSIVTKPGNTYFTAKIDSEIKIA